MNRFTTRLLALLLAAVASSPAAHAQVTGLSDWSLYLDPGHSQTENGGIYGYSEAEKVLRVGLALRAMLETRTDIESVGMTRTTDTQSVSLSQRVDAANGAGADYFHSIHSNAAGPSTNFLFVLWPQLQSGAEGVPNGGKAMAEAMGPALAAGMRIGTRGTNGGFGECDFYGTSSCRTSVPKGSRNFVQSFTTMASTLSEAGFHTSPVQNTRNMNAEWKRLEAQAMYWAILDWHGIARSTHRIATGIVSDVESGRPLNGATVTIDGQTYTTDTFESLFNRYADDPDELANGFYYLEDLGAGTHAVTVSAEGYGTFTGSITMNDTDFTFLDAALLSTVPPTVTATTPEPDATNVLITNAVTLSFSRPMDRAATEAAFSLTPAGGEAAAGTFAWGDDDTRLVFTPADELASETVYTLALAGSAAGAAGDALDGDGDGTGGDAFSLSFTSGFPDASAPRLTASSPSVNAQDVTVRPVVTVAFDELVDRETLDGRVGLERSGDGASVAGRVQATDVMNRTVVSFAPDEALAPNTAYRFAIQPGVEDLFLNATTSPYRVFFTTGETGLDATSIDAFEGSSIDDNWWLPQQSGSTAGIVTDSTDRRVETDVVNPLGGTSAMRIDYGWDDGDGPWLIRQYLNSGAPFARRFTASSGTLQAYVYGDGNGTLFRFAVDDATSTEVSPWVTVDWFGWRVVEWDLGVGETGTWLGNANGTLDGSLGFDSIQLGYAPGAPRFGSLVVDDLQLVQAVSVDDEAGPESAERLVVLANRPNPFREVTEIPFRLASPTTVTVRVFNALGQTVATLTENEALGAGAHRVSWDARGAAPGVYLVRVDADGVSRTTRAVVAR